MKDNLEEHLINPKKLKHFRVVLTSVKGIKWIKDILGIFYKHFFVRTT